MQQQNILFQEIDTLISNHTIYDIKKILF